MARPSFAFALILPPFLALQLFVSGTQAFRCNDDDDFDCNDENEDPATRRRNRIIGASVAGACLLLIAVAYLIYAYRKRRIRARLVPAYPFVSAPAGFAPPPGPPPPDHQGYGYAHGYGYGYGQEYRVDEPKLRKNSALYVKALYDRTALDAGSPNIKVWSK
ncbi:hypothetical protein FB451DRAFT_1177058 [Mycena latifolia]|nr:hypothetical protein FB451DRAFT_1177058 [Mycena latifolia]